MHPRIRISFSYISQLKIYEHEDLASLDSLLWHDSSIYPDYITSDPRYSYTFHVSDRKPFATEVQILTLATTTE